LTSPGSQIVCSKEAALALHASAQAGGNAGRDSFKIRLQIFLEKSSDFVQSSEPGNLKAIFKNYFKSY